MWPWRLPRESLTERLGVAFSYEMGGECHDMHHRDFNCNFGVAFYLCDRLYGSYRDERGPGQRMDPQRLHKKAS